MYFIITLDNKQNYLLFVTNIGLVLIVIIMLFYFSYIPNMSNILNYLFRSVKTITNGTLKIDNIFR